MAYFNGYPATYQQLYPAFSQPYAPVQQQTQPVQATTQSGRIWVQGYEGAKSYLVAPNCTVDLWDSENPVLYQKSADASGMPSIKIIDYTVRDPSQNTSKTAVTIANDNIPTYATKADIEAVSEQITAFCKKIEKLIKKQEESEDE